MSISPLIWYNLSLQFIHTFGQFFQFFHYYNCIVVVICLLATVAETVGQQLTVNANSLLIVSRENCGGWLCVCVRVEEGGGVCCSSFLSTS